MNTIRTTLAGKEIVLGITGSIAAVDGVKLAHALRRCGADVQGVMTDAACGILHPDAITYATGHETLTRCGGLVEHVTYCGDGGSADLLLIAPATANTICKIAHGIDDTPVTTFATTAIGSGMPVILVPAMHESMYRHPGVCACLETLKTWGITVVDPRIEEGKAKIANIDTIVHETERVLSGMPLRGKSVLITSGPCRERLDDVRVLTTRSSGRMGKELAREASRLGAEVWLVHADTLSVPHVRNVYAESAGGMRESILSLCAEQTFDYYISAAAISDFAPAPYEGKIPSGQTISIDLLPRPKIIQDVMQAKNRPKKVVGFKLGWNSREEARHLLDAGADMVAANTPDALGAETGAYELMTTETSVHAEGTKAEVAEILWRNLQ
ncbi:bifunctional phosphopantothenoylcysteine decarboxylase/phosphopantothenate--cysteine ligase CoaBC [Methanogenium sp. S4BF]|uniref:bifunctional phosphopantothenoylcysteine decarboxylase/phosphopantothenate--cysteine ligase CoaBC n=1 Tax=Methanogenium sp. S4BF TaxID=1789226 RepID=UPI002417EBCC|nr:bifunctional phosphopantothenoylcysteine decarboxylase/phosphopantothenate--cysteine ligase CoaBC [Methanogenium sp. S4BF]WFN35298.1 bifunctional phosphopantothenoylcysteine decarboxylase/phosphopantothenate--cysteine ligase CoaBC [Methanogenium sp. S4BF]